MKKYGHQLQFISWIKRDGSGTEPLSQEYITMLQDEKLRLIRLSISQDTYIAYGFNCYVVKLKDSDKGAIKLSTPNKEHQQSPSSETSEKE